MYVLREAKETSAIFFQRHLFYFQFYMQGGVSIQLLQFPFACYILLLRNSIWETWHINVSAFILVAHFDLEQCSEFACINILYH
jgi:hypothetical protein